MSHQVSENLSAANPASDLFRDVTQPGGSILLPNIPQKPARLPTHVKQPPPDGFRASAAGILSPIPAPKQAEAMKIALPNPMQTVKLAFTGEARINTESIIHFSASPWGYITKQLAQYRLSSPFDELRANRGSNGINPSTLDVTSLKFIQEKEIIENLGQFYQFLEKYLDELFIPAASSQEELTFVANSFLYLNHICQMFLYKFGLYKYDAPQILDRLAAKIDASDFPRSPQNRRLIEPILDFASFFLPNNSSAAQTLLDLSDTAHSNHPLQHKLRHVLNKEPDGKFAENVGLEIEGIPTLLFGEVPGNFELGQDGAGTMPEYRRDKTHLKFDLEYKADLFDFWYFARMSKLVGASVHVHLDDPDRSRIIFFRQFLQTDNQRNLKASKPGAHTVQLRFNLPAYQFNAQNDEAWIDLSSEFLTDAYNLVPLVEILLAACATGSDQTQPALDAPDYWIQALIKKGRHTQELHHQTPDFTQVVNACQEWNWYPSMVETILDDLREPLSFEQLLIIFDASGRNTDVALAAIRRCQKILSLEQLEQIYEYTSHSQRIAIEGSTKLVSDPTLNQITALGAKYNWDTPLLSSIFQQINKLNSEQVINLGELSGWNSALLVQAIKKLDSFTFDQMLTICQRSNWQSSAVLEMISCYQGQLSLAQLNQMAEGSRWSVSVVREAIKRLDGTINRAQMDQICERGMWYPELVEESIKKLSSGLKLEEVHQICEKFSWNIWIATAAINKLEDHLTLEQALPFCRRTRMDIRVTDAAFARLEAKLSYDQLLSLIQERYFSVDVAVQAISHLNTYLTLDQSYHLCQTYNWRTPIVIAVIKKMRRNEPNPSALLLLQSAFQSKAWLRFVEWANINATLVPGPAIRIQDVIQRTPEADSDQNLDSEILQKLEMNSVGLAE